MALSPVPSVADLVTTAEIANSAVTSAKIKNGTVAAADLSESAKGAKVIRHDLGAQDFAFGQDLVGNLPGTWNHARVAGNEWSALMYNPASDTHDAVPGDVANGVDYRLKITDTGMVTIEGESDSFYHSEIYLFRTISTSSIDARP